MLTVLFILQGVHKVWQSVKKIIINKGVSIYYLCMTKRGDYSCTRKIHGLPKNWGLAKGEHLKSLKNSTLTRATHF